jgi:AmmeMemoRadiSam system protein A
MPIISAHILPHPPLIVPAVGKGREREIQKTIDSCLEAAKAIARDKPETIIIITPHGTTYADYYHISPGERALGSLARFGVPDVRFDVAYDTDLVSGITVSAKKRGIPAGTDGGHDPDLDHATTVPLYFINQYLSDYKVVRISASGFDLEKHFDYGQCINDAIGDKRVVLVASGDLSHRLTEDGPYGFNAHGPAFDERITRAMAEGDFSKFFDFDDDMIEGAAECGLRGFAIMAGVLDGLLLEVRFHSYEGPFGVGYGVCSYSVRDMHVHLARQSLKYFLETGEYMPRADKLPYELTQTGFGAFVSLKKHGQLRGCIGTITGVQENLADEIITNAVSAGVRDPRFPPVDLSELHDLDISVDVLYASEPAGVSDLDHIKYGVIVTSGYRRGLLLPNLEGVDSVAQQLSIALQKAGIREDEKYSIERFEVVRHT